MSSLIFLEEGEVLGPVVYISEEEYIQMLTEDIIAIEKKSKERAAHLSEDLARLKKKEEKRLKKIREEDKLLNFRMKNMKEARSRGWSKFRVELVGESLVQRKVFFKKGERKVKRMERHARKKMFKRWLKEKDQKIPIQVASENKVVAEKENFSYHTEIISIRKSEIHPFPEKLPLKGGSRDGVIDIKIENENKITPKQILHEYLQKRNEKIPKYAKYVVEDKNKILFGCICTVVIKEKSYVFKVRAEYSRIIDAEQAVASEAYNQILLMDIKEEEKDKEDVNYKSCLQQYCVRKGLGYPLYTIFQEKEGFKCTVLVCGKEYNGYGKRKKISENEAAKSCWLSLVDNDNEQISMDYKSRLYEYCCKKKIGKPVFTYETCGPDNEKLWRSRCTVDDLFGLSSWCQNKKKSENESSRKICEILESEVVVPSVEFLDIYLQDSVKTLLKEVPRKEKEKRGTRDFDVFDEIISKFSNGEEEFRDLQHLVRDQDDKDGYYDKGKESSSSSSLSQDESSDDLGDEILFSKNDDDFFEYDDLR